MSAQDFHGRHSCNSYCQHPYFPVKKRTSLSDIPSLIKPFLEFIVALGFIYGNTSDKFYCSLCYDDQKERFKVFDINQIVSHASGHSHILAVFKDVCSPLFAILDPYREANDHETLAKMLKLVAFLIRQHDSQMVHIHTTNRDIVYINAKEYYQKLFATMENELIHAVHWAQNEGAEEVLAIIKTRLEQQDAEDKIKEGEKKLAKSLESTPTVNKSTESIATSSNPNSITPEDLEHFINTRYPNGSASTSPRPPVPEAPRDIVWERTSENEAHEESQACSAEIGNQQVFVEGAHSEFNDEESDEIGNSWNAECNVQEMRQPTLGNFVYKYDFIHQCKVTAEGGLMHSINPRMTLLLHPLVFDWGTPCLNADLPLFVSISDLIPPLRCLVEIINLKTHQAEIWIAEQSRN